MGCIEATQEAAFLLFLLWLFQARARCSCPIDRQSPPRLRRARDLEGCVVKTHQNVPIPARSFYDQGVYHAVQQGQDHLSAPRGAALPIDLAAGHSGRQLPFDAAMPHSLLNRRVSHAAAAASMIHQPFAISAADMTQRRHSSNTPTASTVPGDASEWQHKYTGPVAPTLRVLKAVSITTATLSVLGSPIVCMTTGGTMAVKVAGATTFALFSIFTTGLLHWFTGPYIHKLWYDPETRRVKVRKLTLFAQYEDFTFNVDDIQPPTGYAPLQTFDVNGRTLYVDPNAFEDKELLGMLTPPGEFDMPSEMSGGSAAAKPDERKE